jgi:hypothetical protein
MTLSARAILPAAFAAAASAGCDATLKGALNTAFPGRGQPVISGGRDIFTGDEIDTDYVPPFDEFWDSGSGVDFVAELGRPTTARFFAKLALYSFEESSGSESLGSTPFTSSLLGLKIGGNQKVWWESYLALASGMVTHPPIRYRETGSGTDIDFFEGGAHPVFSAAVGLNISAGLLKFFVEYEGMASPAELQLTSEAESFMASAAGLTDVEADIPMTIKLNMGLRFGW